MTGEKVSATDATNLRDSNPETPADAGPQPPRRQPRPRLGDLSLPENPGRRDPRDSIESQDPAPRRPRRTRTTRTSRRMPLPQRPTPTNPEGRDSEVDHDPEVPRGRRRHQPKETIPTERPQLRPGEPCPPEAPLEDCSAKAKASADRDPSPADDQVSPRRTKARFGKYLIAVRSLCTSLGNFNRV